MAGNPFGRGLSECRADSLLTPPLPVAGVQQLQAFATGHYGPVVRGDAFHLGPVCGFPVAGIAQHHAVCIQGMPVAFPPSVSGHLVSSHVVVKVAAIERVAA